MQLSIIGHVIIFVSFLWGALLYLASHCATKFMKQDGGIIILTGAEAALSENDTMPSTSFMIGYGLSKAATHHLTKSLA